MRGECGKRPAHLCPVPDDGRPGVAQFVSARPFVVVDEEKVILKHTHGHTRTHNQQADRHRGNCFLNVGCCAHTFKTF